jgi:hypothetical protein
MRLSNRLAVIACAALIAACTGSGSASPSASPASPSGSPGSSATSGPDPDTATYWLRAMTTQALPPINRFPSQPAVVITGDGQWITQGPVMEIYPGPLLPNLRSRQVSEAGRAAILVAAKDLGLLDGRTDFSAGPVLAGGVSGRIELTVGGRRIEITGNPASLMECVTAPCEPPAGSAAAFAEFWRRLGDLPSWIPGELGPDVEYVSPAYAILVGHAPLPDASLPQPPMVWPLAQPLALFGGPVAGGTARCGTASGDDATTLRAAFAKANVLTQWAQDPSTSATLGVTVRPMVPGEDVCRELFGAGG